MSDARLRDLERAAAQGDPEARLRLCLARARAGQAFDPPAELAASLGHPELAVANRPRWVPEVASVVRAGRHAVRIWVSGGGGVTAAVPSASLCGIRLNPRELAGQDGGWPGCEGCIRVARGETYSVVALWGWVAERPGAFIEHPTCARAIWEAASEAVYDERSMRESGQHQWLRRYGHIMQARHDLRRLPTVGPQIADTIEDLWHSRVAGAHLPVGLAPRVALYALAFCSMLPSDMEGCWAKRSLRLAKALMTC